MVARRFTLLSAGRMFECILPRDTAAAGRRSGERCRRGPKRVDVCDVSAKNASAASRHHAK